MLRSLAALLVASAAGAAPPPKPNVVFVLTDDQAKWSVGCYGNPQAKTPNLDRLAATGVRFANAFVTTPVCSPSRASYMTGRHGIEFGVTDWIAPVEKEVGLPAGVVTWPKLLQQAGYQTALVGKWHLGAQPHQHPTKNGFDHFYGHIGGGWAPKDPTLEVNGKPTKLDGFSVDLLTDEAIRWVRERRAGPFAVCVHYREPHTPYGPMPPQDEAAYRDAEIAVPDAPGIDKEHVTRQTRQYLAACTAVDRNLGRILAELDALKLTDSTVVIYASDHGYNIGHHSIQHKGNGHWIAGGVNGPKRPNMWDTSLGVPLVVRRPGAATKPGTVLNHVVANIDVLQSVCGMCGVAVPKEANARGVDFSPLLDGEQVKGWRSDLYGAYDLHNGGLAYMRMVRTPQWKFVRHLRANNMDELYDLVNDPGETRNLVGTPKSAAPRAELQAKLAAWRKSIGDPLAR